MLAAATELVRQRTGLIYSEARRAAFDAGVAKAMHLSGLADPHTFLTRLASDASLLDTLVGEITIGETYFFRDPDQMGMIGREIMPDLCRRHGDLRFWSAGCASGEEPYTLAILLQQLGHQGRARILGTDLSRTALARARRGRYGAWSFRGVPAEIVDRYFRRIGGSLEPIPTVRSEVEFRYLNLAEDTYPSLAAGIGGMDLIVCRNVLIYFDRETIARVARRLVDSLSDDGWLVLGASDPAILEFVRCDVQVHPTGLAYRRAGATGTSGATVWGREAIAPSVAPPPDGPEPHQFSPPEAFLPPAWVPPPEPAPLVDGASAGPESPVDGAAALYQAHDYQGASDYAAARLGRGDDDPGLWIVLVRALANRGALAEAGRACATALERHATIAELVCLHAVLLSEAGRCAEAAAAARRALYLDRTLAIAHLTLGAALARVGDPAGAERAFRNAERLLVALPETAVVPASDGELAGRLVRLARTQAQLVRRGVA